MKNLFIIIPIYNESSLLAELFNRLDTFLRHFTEKESLLLHDIEVIFINDGSSDDSLAILIDFCQQHNYAKCINLSRNFGHQLAITAGLHHAKAKAMVVMDADLQDPPEFIADLYPVFKQGYDVVYALRSQRDGESFFKKKSADIFYRLFSLFSKTVIHQNCGDFRLMSARFVHVFKQFPEPHRFIRGMVPWIGFKQKAIYYKRDARYAGTSHYSLLKMCRLALHALLSFSAAPLRLITFFGFFLACLSFFYASYVFLAKVIFNNHVPGWASLIIAMMFLFGMQFIFLGILGEYVSKIFEQNQKRPLFIIENIYDHQSS